MPTKIFVGKLADGTTSEEISKLFGKFGTVVECDVITSYGFVHMSTEEEAKAAINALDGYSVNGSHIHVELSTASTQGRKKRYEASGDRGSFSGGRNNGGGRYEPYQSSRRDNYSDSRSRGAGGMADTHRKEEYASDQVKDLLELYIRDPVAFDQYAKAYYYGERSERAMTRAYRSDDVASRGASSYSVVKPSYASQSSYDRVAYESSAGLSRLRQPVSSIDTLVSSYTDRAAARPFYK